MLISIAPFLLFFIFPCLFLVSGIFDVLTGRIPDWVSGMIVLAFFGYAILAGWSLETILYHCGICILVFFAGFVFFAFGWAGGGDGKLAAAGALWFGPSAVIDFLALSFIFGGLLVGIVFLLRMFPLSESMVRTKWLQRWVAGNDGLPFGLAMAAAVLVMRQIGFEIPA